MIVRVLQTDWIDAGQTAHIQSNEAITPHPAYQEEIGLGHVVYLPGVTVSAKYIAG